MIYVITGASPRCGSAMMMKALEAGGLEIAFDPKCDEAADCQADEDYHPNEEGIFEFPLLTQITRNWPLGYEGKCVKCFPPPWGPLTHLPRHEYKVLWMNRDSEARWESFKRFHERHGLIITKAGLGPEMFLLRDMAAQASFNYVAGRDDMELLTVGYEGVLENPDQIFQDLAEMGWPIDPEKAAKVPDKDRKRF